MPGPAPLRAADAGALLQRGEQQFTAEWNGQKSEKTFHIFVNQTDEPLRLCWALGKDQDADHGVIEPGHSLYVGTYTFHEWRVHSRTRGLVGSYTGPSAVVTLSPSGGCTAELNAHSSWGGASCSDAGGKSGASSHADPTYRMRGSALGMPVWAYDCVGEAAVQRLVHVVECMLAHCPAAVLERMRQAKASFAIVGRNQVVSDMPPHRFMRYNSGRDLDATARGLGASPHIPVTSVGEENVTMEDDKLYSCQSILVHELAHAVLNLAVTNEQALAVCETYKAALAAGLYRVEGVAYPQGVYMLENEQEYWAVAVEAWFESTVRRDVNGGISTRAGVRAHDPRLAALLEATFGDGPWRYHHDCPRPLAMPTWRSRRPARLSSELADGTPAPTADSQAPTVITILEQDGATTMPWGPLSLPVPSSSSCLACMPSCRCLSWSCADCGGGRSTGCGGVVCWTCIAAALTQYGRRVKDMHNRE